MTKFLVKNSDGLGKAIHFLSNINLNYEWDLEIKRHVKKRTNPQNNLYWQWMTIAGKATGYFKDEFSYEMKKKFLIPEIVESHGMKVERYKSTKDMDVGELSGFMKLIDMFCARDLGIMLPHPSDMHYESR